MEDSLIIPPNVRCCVEDANGNSVFVGDTVIASDGHKYVVGALAIEDAEHAWIVAKWNGEHLIPRLCELMG